MNLNFRKGNLSFSFFLGLSIFHFSLNIFSFSKWISEWAFIFKMGFFFWKCAFIFKMWKVLWVLFFPFSEKHNCEQKSEHSLQMALLIKFWTNNEIYIELLNLFQLSRIYNLLYLFFIEILRVRVGVLKNKNT